MEFIQFATPRAVQPEERGWAMGASGRSFALSVTMTSPLSIAGRSEPGTIRQIKGVGTVVFEQEAVPGREQQPDRLKCLCMKRLCRVEPIGPRGRPERSLSKRVLLLRERRDFPAAFQAMPQTTASLAEMSAYRVASGER